MTKGLLFCSFSSAILSQHDLFFLVLFFFFFSSFSSLVTLLMIDYDFATTRTRRDTQLIHQIFWLLQVGEIFSIVLSVKCIICSSDRLILNDNITYGGVRMDARHSLMSDVWCLMMADVKAKISNTCWHIFLSLGCLLVSQLWWKIHWTWLTDGSKKQLERRKLLYYKDFYQFLGLAKLKVFFLASSLEWEGNRCQLQQRRKKNHFFVVACFFLAMWQMFFLLLCLTLFFARKNHTVLRKKEEREKTCVNLRKVKKKRIFESFGIVLFFLLFWGLDVSLLPETSVTSSHQLAAVTDAGNFRLSTGPPPPPPSLPIKSNRFDSILLSSSWWVHNPVIKGSLSFLFFKSLQSHTMTFFISCQLIL